MAVTYLCTRWLNYSFSTRWLLHHLIFFISSVDFVSSAPGQTLQNNDVEDKCVHTLPLTKPAYFKRHFDPSFWKKFFKHWIPFTSADRVKMQFFLYKRDFPECGREIRTDDEESISLSGFNPNHPTR